MSRVPRGSKRSTEMRNRLQSLYKSTRGASLVEYALLLALILVVSAVVVKTLGQKVTTATQLAGQKF